MIHVHTCVIMFHFSHDNHSMVFFHRILTQFDWYMPDSIANWIVFAQLRNSPAEVLALLNSCATTSYSAVILTNTYFLYWIHTFLNLPTDDFGKRDKKKMDAICSLLVLVSQQYSLFSYSDFVKILWLLLLLLIHVQCILFMYM